MAKDSYETFDSGSGVLIPKGDKDNYDHRDSNLNAKGDEGQDEELKVPAMK